MNENQSLKELGITNKAPFKVPEGYFDTLSSRVMGRIKEEDRKAVVVEMEKPRRMKRIAAWVSTVAACLIIAVVGTEQFLDINKDADQLSHAEVVADEYEQEMMNYSMVDNMDVYSYLAGNDY